ncbi:MAG: hypothetical protein NXI09_03645 [Bacteroidetes bacterium]|nr:hypothetical protein [Bacteroidota bacterium]
MNRSFKIIARPKLVVALFTLCASSTLLNAQTHHIGLNFGVNQLLSIDEGPPFGDNSPWESRLGFGANLNYQYAFSNNLVIGFGYSYLGPRFIDPDVSILMEGQNGRVITDELLFHYYQALGLELGYGGQMSKRYSIQFSTGPGFIYHYKQRSYAEGYEETAYVADFDFSKDRIYYGINLNIKQSYTIYQKRSYRINLTANLRLTYIFDYLQRNNSIDRILPQVYLGVELELGRRRR